MVRGGLRMPVNLAVEALAVEATATKSWRPLDVAPERPETGSKGKALEASSILSVLASIPGLCQEQPCEGYATGEDLCSSLTCLLLGYMLPRIPLFKRPSIPDSIVLGKDRSDLIYLLFGRENLCNALAISQSE